MGKQFEYSRMFRVYKRNGCPHYQEEADRKPDLHKFLLDGKAIPGYAIDGGRLHILLMANILKAFSFIQIHMFLKYLKSRGSVEELQLKMEKL